MNGFFRTQNLLSYIFLFISSATAFSMDNECFRNIENKYAHPLGMWCICPSRSSLALDKSCVQERWSNLKTINNSMLEISYLSEPLKKYFIFAKEFITKQIETIATNNDEFIVFNDRYLKFINLVINFINDKEKTIDENAILDQTQKRYEIVYQENRKELIRDYQIFLHWLKGECFEGDFSELNNL